ncbi:transcription factor bHLH143-like [Solanum dulcamara]|uniref:transcription factor bHLH143-like n=1 Tax=Solanum dulcamara TaxID=45834 RepID=UPI002485E747|nr:transcription factor bHLH143-like [Solanum dulcamara]
MVTTSKLQYYQLDPACTSPNVNYATTLLQPGHHLGVPSLYTPAICAANAVSTRRSCFVPCLPNSKAAHQNGVNWLQNLAPTKNEYPSDTKCLLPHLIGLKSPPTDASTNSQKRFLICDQSGNQTRFFFSQGRPPENEIITSKELVGAYGLYQNENLNAVVEQRSHVRLVIGEKLDESYVDGEESNTHEDTDEINALLYSSDDIEGDEDDDVYGEDDEVTSTDRSPWANQGFCGCDEHEQQSTELTEEVASSDGTCKRQRLLDGGYKKSSSIESRGPNDDVEARCVRGSLPSSWKDKDSCLITRERKVKIRETLRILESLIPGLKSKDPLLVIDEAINYLKSLRGKAKALGVDLPQENPPASC